MSIEYFSEKQQGRWREQFGRNKFICLYVGRLSSEMGLDYYMDAIRELDELNIGKDIVFVFAGDGPYCEELKNCELKNVKLIEAVRDKNLEELYENSDIFISPSGTNNFDNILDAMAGGMPCICVDEGRVTDIVENGKNALIVPYQNTKELENAIVGLKENRVLCDRLSAGALCTVAQGKWDVIMDDRLEHSYEAAI